jgi:two-component system, NarL family, sensor kinase
MSLKSKLILLGLVPLLVVTSVFSLVTLHQGKNLAKKELVTFEQNLMHSKETSLRDYVSVMRKAIDAIRTHSPDEQEAQRRVIALIQDSHFSDDGYFFAYSSEGVNLAHAVQPYLNGQNLLDLQDSNGKYVIRNLLQKAATGGGYFQYSWRKPSNQEMVDKISYVEKIPDWNWMYGTGLYIDDIAFELQHLKEAVNTNVKQTLLIILAALISAIMILVGAAIWFNIREQHLADKNLKELSHKTVQHQEEVRRRVSRELHDGINQLLVSVKYHLETALNRLPGDKESARQPIELGEKVLSQAIQEVRRISHDLRPIMLDDLGLLAALTQLLDDYAERTGMEMDVDIQPPEKDLPEEIATTLYRIVQEALTNIEKHACASKLILSLEEDAEGLFLCVKDNGVGLKASAAYDHNGIGLRNMRERVEFLGGEFNVESRPGAGTRILATFAQYH